MTPKVTESHVTESAETAETTDTAMPDDGTPTDGDPTGDDRHSVPASEPSETELPETLTFRITRTAMLAVIAFAVCATPVASAYVWLLPIYLLPLALLVWVMRLRTTVSADEIHVRTLTGSSRFSWDEVQSVKLRARGWVEAVLNSDERVTLPAVRVRDLSWLSAMSRGRLPDPTR